MEKNSCPFCGSERLLESSAIVHEPYEDKELKVYRCLECGQGFNEDEMGDVKPEKENGN